VDAGGQDVLRHLLSLRLMSPLTSLDYSWLVWVESSLLDTSHLHVRKAFSVRYVPSTPIFPLQHSPASPLPSPLPIERDVWRGTYRIHPPSPPRVALTTHLKALPWRQQLSTLDHDESWIWNWNWICPFSISFSFPMLLCR